MGRGVARTTANSGDDLYDNPDSRLRYEAYRCDYLRYEAYRYR